MITFRLADSIPQSNLIPLKLYYENQVKLILGKNEDVQQKLKDELAIEIFGKYEHQLEKKPYGNCILNEPKVATLIYDKILEYHKNLFLLKCFSIMPNHVHIVLGSKGDTPLDQVDDVSKWMQLIKGGTSRQINELLGTNDKIWADGFWDRFIRNENHYHNAFYYTVDNPSKAFLSNTYNSKPYMWRKDKDELNF